MDYFKLWMTLKKKLLTKPEDDRYGSKYDRQLEILHTMNEMEVSEALHEELCTYKNQTVEEYAEEKLPEQEPIMTVGLRGEE